jgi:very-short-patch-repair endonuclease
MRHDATKGEDKLWEMLRDRQCGGFKFRRQVPMDGYVLDFYGVERKLAIELDGDQHYEPVSLNYDEWRTKDLTQRGIRVLRFPSPSVFHETELVRESILMTLEKEPSPRPSPGVPGEGEKQ